jgi:hypothetical protein
MKSIRLALLTAASLAAPACGQTTDLQPAPGHALPVKPLLAKSTPTAEQLLTPPTNARPARVDELIRRSEPRRPDRFDLPPADGGLAPVLPQDPDPTSSEQTGVSNPK